MKKALTALVITVTAISISGVSTVFAQDTLPPARPGRTGSRYAGATDTHTAAPQRDLDEVAAALGMTIEELNAALDSGATVHDLLTAAGIDLTDWMASYLYNYSVDRISSIAEALGMTVEELQAAMLETGLTARELAADLGIDLEVWDNDWAYGTAGGNASALDMTVEELQAAIDAGSTMRDLYDDAGLEFPAGGSGSASRGGNGAGGRR